MQNLWPQAIVFFVYKNMLVTCELQRDVRAENKLPRYGVDCFLNNDWLSPIILVDARMKRLCICVEFSDRRTNQ